MLYLITGSKGQLGQEWVHFLDAKRSTFKAYSSSELDITDKDRVMDCLNEVRPDILINCAAYTDVDGAEKEFEEAHNVNATGVENLVTACQNLGTKLVHYSTDYVFSGQWSDQEKYPSGYPENAESNPVNEYGKSKQAGESILLESNCEWLLIRVSWLCGRYGNNFVKTMLRLGADRDQLQIVDDQIGCPSFAFDVVEKTEQLIKKDESGIFHLSSTGAITWADLAEEIFAVSGYSVNVNRIPSAKYPFIAKRPMFTLLSNNKALQKGLHPISWKTGLHRLLDQMESIQDIE